MSLRSFVVGTCSAFTLCACVSSEVSEPMPAHASARPLHAVAAPSDHGVYLAWPDHPETATFTVRWREAENESWSEKQVGNANHAFIPSLNFGTEHQIVVTGHGASAAFFDTLYVTPRDRPDCAYVEYTVIQSFFCSQAAADAAMRVQGVNANELRCRNKPVVNWGPDSPDCLYTTSGKFRFLLLRNADTHFTKSSVPPTVSETRSALRYAIWKSNDPFGTKSKYAVSTSTLPMSGDVTRFKSVETLVFDDGRPYKSRVTHFTPYQRVDGRIAIFHEGHGEPGTVIGSSMIEFLLDRGWEVYAMDMPIHGRNRVDRTPGIDTTHFDWWKLDNGSTSPIAAFMLPIKYLVDHITSTRTSISDLMLMGRSGGGYSSYVYSALDPRITITVSVAGGRPISQRLDAPWGALELGDLEQTAPEVFSGIRHEDLMIASGSRASIMMFNTFDGCCFRVSRGDPFLTYLEEGGARTGRKVRGFADPVNPTHGLGPIGFEALDNFLTEVMR